MRSQKMGGVSDRARGLIDIVPDGEKAARRWRLFLILRVRVVRVKGVNQKVLSWSRILVWGTLLDFLWMRWWWGGVGLSFFS
ncbi:MAG: hypothetical protein IPJ40_11970 [Saprospirales bacterium]|nr:hypothetical protein [Saprospirales bacterium]